MLEQVERTTRPDLTPRQQQCLELVARGLSSKQVGRTLGLSHRTVDEHLQCAFRQLGVSNRVQAAVLIAQTYIAPER